MNETREELKKKTENRRNGAAKMFRLLTGACVFGLFLSTAGCRKVEETPNEKITLTPTAEPTTAPTAEPTIAPTAEPTIAPTAEPTIAPTTTPTPAAENPNSVNNAKKDKLYMEFAETAVAQLDAIPVSEETTPMFWKATKEGMPGTFYMLGSFHVTDETAYPVNEKIMEAYRRSNQTIFEFDMLPYECDTDKALELSSMMINPGMKTVDKFIGSDLTKRAKAFLTERGAYQLGMELMTPATWSSMMATAMYEEAGVGSLNGYDVYFDSLSYLDYKKVFSFESADFQMNLLASEDVRQIKMEMEDILDETSRAEGIVYIKEMYDAWKYGKESDLESMVSEEYSDEDYASLEADLLEAIKEYNKNMLDDRNDGMVEKIKSMMAEDKVTFCVVGAAHYLGEKGIVEQLRNDGYTVEMILGVPKE